MVDQAVLEALHMMGNMTSVIKDTHGNVSGIDRSEGLIYIKPSGMDYSSVKLYEVCLVDLDGAQYTMSHKPSVDSVHHAIIYKNNTHVKAICHTHSPYAVAFATSYLDLICYTTEQADYFGRDIRCLPYSDLNSWGENVKLEPGEKAVLMQRHGVLTFADTPVEAVKLAAALEVVAEKNFLVKSLGAPGRLPIEEREKWHKRYSESYGQGNNTNSI